MVLHAAPGYGRIESAHQDDWRLAVGPDQVKDEQDNEHRDARDDGPLQARAVLVERVAPRGSADVLRYSPLTLDARGGFANGGAEESRAPAGAQARKQ